MYLLPFYKSTLINTQRIKYEFDFVKKGLLHTSKTDIQKFLVYNVQSVITNIVKK